MSAYYIKILLPVIAGLTATFFMTLFTEVGFRALKKNYHVVRILGNMLRFGKITPLKTIPPAGFHISALVLHYAIGVVFAYLYYWLREAGVVNLTLAHSFLFGIIIGTIAIFGWRFFFGVHPGPPPVELKYYLPIIWLGHIILSIVVFATYQSYLKQPIVENIPICQ